MTRTALASLLLLPLLPVAGCAQQPADEPGTDVGATASAIELADGGLTTADEAPEFAAADEFAAAQLERDVAPPAAAADPSAMPAGAIARDVLVMWGKFPPDPLATTRRDWSGQLALSRGALRVTREVAFEDRTDAVLPRTDPASVAFDSMTRPASDGLALAMIAPAADPSTPPAPWTLTYSSNAGATPLAIDLDALADGPVALDAGDGFSLVAVGTRHDDACRAGFMRGRWRALNDHLGGYLGVVTGRGGDVIGHVRGIYGVRKDGTHVMFGKFIGADGAFLGLLRGTFDQDGYHARWIDRAGEHGVAGGKVFAAPAGARGAFLGRWAETGCAEDAAP